jgi:N-methylhydantoinase A
MVALGGAGPMHAARVAERFDIDAVILPFGTGVGSAIGLLTTDITAERSRTEIAAEHDVDFGRVGQLFDELAAACADDLAADRDSLGVERMVGMRYLGQSHEIVVTAPDGDLDPTWLKHLIANFHDRYSEVYGKTLQSPAEIVSVRVKVTQPVATLRTAPVTDADSQNVAPVRSRPAHFAERGAHVDTPVYDRTVLGAGSNIAGPAIIEERESTIVVPPTWTAVVDELANVVLTRVR